MNGTLRLRNGNSIDYAAPTRMPGVDALFAPSATPTLSKWAADRAAKLEEPDDSHWAVPDLGGEDW